MTTNYSFESLYRYAQPAAPAPVKSWAQQYPEEAKWINSSTFDFAVRMRDVLRQWGGLTPGQLAAVHKCMAYRAQPPSEAAGLDLSKVPSGLYAVPGGDTRLKVKVSHGSGKWQGWIFVADASEYGQARRYGAQRPQGSYQGSIVTQLTQIAADPKAASAAYGRLTSTCGICGRPLENEESVAAGIGPVCAGRMGW